MTADCSSKIGYDQQQRRSTEAQCGYGQFQVLKAALRKPDGTDSCHKYEGQCHADKIIVG
jgi:hypothetical protein